MSEQKDKASPETSEPKRIYNWLHTQLSVARFYGGMTLNGVMYVIRYDLEGQPLEEVPLLAPKKTKRKPRKKKIETTEELPWTE